MNSREFSNEKLKICPLHDVPGELCMKTFLGQVAIPVRLGDCFGCVETEARALWRERREGEERKSERERA